MTINNRLQISLLLGVVLLSSSVSMASEKTDSDWTTLLAANKLTKADQAYCYTDESGKAQGENIDLRVRLASVSKLMTSLWAMEKLGPDYKFETKLFIKGKNLHIAGSFDPFLGNEKMFFLVSQLNDLGYTEFDTITFDKIIQINPGAQSYAEQYPLITRATNAKNLKTYFNTASWSKVFKAEYNRIAGLSPKGKFRSNVDFKIGDAVFSETNPFESFDDVKMLTLSSPPLYKYLKETNIHSNNYTSQTLFLKLGGVEKFQEFMAERFGLTTDTIKFMNGSGLPTITDGVRFDNYATCATVSDLIIALKGSAERQGRELEDIMAVPGSDGGTFRNRTFPSEYKNAFVAKTGTLMHTSTLAGAMSTQKGYSFYGVFNQTTNISGAKQVQNAMVKTIMTEMGGPLAFDYIVDSFHTYGNDNVKNMEFDFGEPSDFIPFEENLL